MIRMHMHVLKNSFRASVLWKKLLNVTTKRLMSGWSVIVAQHGTTAHVLESVMPILKQETVFIAVKKI